MIKKEASKDSQSVEHTASNSEAKEEEEQTFRVNVRSKTPGVIRKDDLRVSRNNFIRTFRDKMRRASLVMEQRSIGLNTTLTDFSLPQFNERRSSIGH